MEAFRKEEVLTDMGISMPAGLLKMKYDSGEVTPGQAITPTQVQKPPKLSWKTECGAFYTLIMNDIDPPSRTDPQLREFHHWMVVNIPCDCVSKGEVLTEFMGSGPGEGTGPHRYVFLVFKQAKKEDFSALPQLKLLDLRERGAQKALMVAQQYGMSGPVAGNFYQAEFDDYVPILHKQLGIA